MVCAAVPPVQLPFSGVERGVDDNPLCVGQTWANLGPWGAPGRVANPASPGPACRRLV